MRSRCKVRKNVREPRKGSGLFSTIKGSLSLLSARQRSAVTLLAFATLAINALDIVAISLLSLIGAIALGETRTQSLPWFEEYDTNTLVIVVLMIAAGVFAFKTVSGIFLTKIRQNFLAKLEVYYSDIIASNIFEGGLSAVKRYSRSDLEWSILRSTSLAFGSVVGLSLSLFAEVSLTIFIFALFFYTDWVSALVVMLYFSLVLLIFQSVTYRKVANTGSDYAEGSVSVGQAIADGLVSYREIAVHSRSSFFLQRISVARSQVARGSALQTYMQQIPRLIVELALIVGAIGFAAFQFATSSGNPDLALISIFIIGSLRIMSSLLPLYRSYMQLHHYGPQAVSSQSLVREAREESIRRLNEKKRKLGNQPNPVVKPSSALSVSLKDVSFSYQDQVNVETTIDSVSLEIEPGSVVALIGASGAGKSTLVDLILGLYDPSSGEISCSGVTTQALRDAFPGLMSYVPQKPGLVSGSIRDNIALGVPHNEVDEETLWQAIRLAELEEFITGLPNGVDSHLGEQNDSLSGGQMQRIGMARALYTEPSLLVLDEATSALDAETEASISESLDKLRGRTTTVVVAHRLSTVQHADKVFVIDKGRLIASGKLKELEKSVPLVKKYISLMSLDS